MKTHHYTVGTDPRELEDFAEIRQEINKINHPDRPSVNWPLITRKAKNIFKKQGIDLQTVTYFTLSKTKECGLEGFTEGIELLADLINTHWQAAWPPSPRARTDLLEWLNGRIGSDIREMPITPIDQPLIERCKIAIVLIKTQLEKSNLTPMPRIVFLLDFIQETEQLLEEQISVMEATLTPKSEPENQKDNQQKPKIKPVPEIKTEVIIKKKIEYIPNPLNTKLIFIVGLSGTLIGILMGRLLG